jgi:hypothetical protein
MRIGLIDIDGKQTNVALMKLSAWHKAQGDAVILNPTSSAQVDCVYCSVLFTWNRPAALRLADVFPNIQYGGTGYDLTTTLPAEVETMRPDYDLYTVEVIEKRIKGIMTKERRRQKAEIIVNAGIGFTSRGCVRSCSFCAVPAKEGLLHSVGTLADLINPRSKAARGLRPGADPGHHPGDRRSAHDSGDRPGPGRGQTPAFSALLVGPDPL